MANIDYKAAYIDALICGLAPTCNGYSLLSDGARKNYETLINNYENELSGDYEADLEYLNEVLEEDLG